MPKNKSLNFVLGVLCLGGGLFLIGQSISVTNVFGAWRMFGFAVPSGLVVLPLLIGIGMLFYNHKSKAWKIVTGFGVLFILLSVILSIRIVVHRVTFFDFILMFGLTAAGVAMLLRFWFYDRK